MKARLVFLKFHYWCIGGPDIRFSDVFTANKVKLTNVDLTQSYRMPNDSIFIVLNKKTSEQFFYPITRKRFETIFDCNFDLNALPMKEKSVFSKFLLKQFLSYLPRGITFHYVITLAIVVYSLSYFRSTLSGLYSNEIENFPLVFKGQGMLTSLTDAMILIFCVNLTGIVAPIISYFVQRKWFPLKYSNLNAALGTEMILILSISLNTTGAAIQTLTKPEAFNQQVLYNIPACRAFGIKESCATLEKFKADAIARKRAVASETKAKTK